MSTPRTKVASRRYVRIRLLGVHFGGPGDKQFGRELQALSGSFTQRFGCISKVWSIPVGVRNATDLVSTRLEEFTTNDDQDDDTDEELLIVVYGGHGYPNPPANQAATNRALLWWSTAQDQYVKWNEIQNGILFPGKKDTLVVLDCCYAGAAERGAYTARKDILAACAWNRRTPIGASTAAKSFTQYMLQAAMSFEVPFTIRNLFEQIRTLGPSESPVYQSLPESPTHDIVLRPLITPGLLVPRTASALRNNVSPGSQKVNEGKASTQGWSVGPIDIYIPIGPTWIKIRISFGKSAKASAMTSQQDATRCLIDRIDNQSLPSRSKYAVQERQFFDIGQTFAIPWPEKAMPVRSSSGTQTFQAETVQDLAFVVVETGSQHFTALPISTPRAERGSSLSSIQPRNDVVIPGLSPASLSTTYILKMDMAVKETGRLTTLHRQPCMQGFRPMSEGPQQGRKAQSSSESRSEDTRVQQGKAAYPRLLDAGYTQSQALESLVQTQQRSSPGLSSEQARTVVYSLLSGKYSSFRTTTLSERPGVRIAQNNTRSNAEEDDEDDDSSENDDAAYSGDEQDTPRRRY